MKLFMKQQLLAWGERIVLCNEAEQTVFSAQAEILPDGARLQVFDAKDLEVANVTQQLLSWRPRYHIEIKGKEIGILLKRFAKVGTRFDVDLLNWTTRGSRDSEVFEVVDHDRVVMTVSPEPFVWGESYSLDIKVKNDMTKAVCILLAIDFSSAAEKHYGVS